MTASIIMNKKKELYRYFIRFRIWADAPLKPLDTADGPLNNSGE
jgi:hypothetical protein